MQVFIYESGNNWALTNSGTTLSGQAGIGNVRVHGRHHKGAAPFETFSQNHPNGITVGGKDNVVLIVGGRKSIIKALTDHSLLLRPAPGLGLAIRVIRQTETYTPAPIRLLHRLETAPKLAINHALGAGGGLGTRLAAGARYFAAVHDAVEETSKKYTYIQVFSGQPEVGDFALGNGGGAVATPALAILLQTIRGWSD
jgi:hypothetical protein